MSFNMNQLGNMVKKMQDEMARIQQQLGETHVSGADPSGKITVKATGHKEIIEIKIAPTAVDLDDISMLEDLVLFAVQDAMKKAEALSQEKLGALTQGMPNIPGLKMPF